MSALAKQKEVINDPIWNKRSIDAQLTIEEFGIGNIQANIIQALEDIQAIRIEVENEFYYETEHYKNTQHVIEISGFVNSCFDLILENDTQQVRLDKLDKLIHNLQCYRNTEFKQVRIVPEVMTVQSVINAIRAWVRNRNGRPFGINDIYSDPGLSAKLPATIGIMGMIDEALIRMGCSISNHGENRKFSDKVYTPRVGRDREIAL